MPAGEPEQQWHVLDFFCDEEGSSALTIFVNGVRFHVIADITKLEQMTEAGANYHEYVRDLQKAGSEGRKAQDSDRDSKASDSGVDVADLQDESPGADKENAEPYDVEDTIKRWMVAPILDSFEDLAPKTDPAKHSTLQDWYHCKTHYCELAVASDGESIEAVQLDATSDLEERLRKFLPSSNLPKYISEKIDCPTFNASELLVIGESDQPPGTAYHPCRVKRKDSDEAYFFKIVDNIQPQATKREVDILRRIQKLGLGKQFNVPTLEGLVTFDEAGGDDASKKTFFGFLQSEIRAPTPLTHMLRGDVPQEKREAWATEVDRIKTILHEHKIIWGDAKADNFMIDANEKLWIIDFGGGYTEGWIDEQYNETEEGDNVGVGKVVNALQDPEQNVEPVDDAEPGAKASNEVQSEDKEADPEKDLGQNDRKRSRAASDIEDDEDVSRSAKASKRR